MLEALKEILSSLKKTSTDRITNPFYGVFILTWLGFNWESVAILLFSDMKMDERVRFINSAYPLIFIYPFVASVFLTLIIPYCTEKLTFFQSKPLGRTSTLLALRKRKVLLADISVERYRAKRDVAYERYKVGAEKEVQDMKEAIAFSAKQAGELDVKLVDANKEIKDLKNKIFELKKLESQVELLNNKNNNLVLQLSGKNSLVDNLQKDNFKLLTQQKEFIDTYKVNINKQKELSRKYPSIFENEKNLFLIRPEIESVLQDINNSVELINESNANISDYKLGRFSSDDKLNFAIHKMESE